MRRVVGADVVAMRRARWARARENIVAGWCEVDSVDYVYVLCLDQRAVDLAARRDLTYLKTILDDVGSCRRRLPFSDSPS